MSRVAILPLACVLFGVVYGQPVADGTMMARQASPSLSPCRPLHMIGVRGTGSPQDAMNGEGATENVIMAVETQLGDAIVNDNGLIYPASSSNPNYTESEGEGTDNILTYIVDYLDQCPDSQLSLVGYSQGGQVIMDALCGTSEAGFNKTEPLDYEKYGKRINSTVVFGDPSFVPGESFDAGTDNMTSGIFPRQNFAACDNYSDRLISFCDTNDKFCASGTSIEVHITYLQRYMTQAVDFIVNHYTS